MPQQLPVAEVAAETAGPVVKAATVDVAGIAEVVTVDLVVMTVVAVTVVEAAGAASVLLVETTTN